MLRFRSSRALVAAALVLVGLVAGACGRREDPTLKIGLLPIVDSLPFWVAEQAGYFEQAGLQVELVPFKSAVERDAAIEAGQIDGMVADMVATSLLNRNGIRYQSPSISLGVTPAEGRFAILAAPNAGITAVEQLKGVEIAISPNSVIDYINEQMLLAAGFRPEEIRTVSIPKIPDRLAALLSGQVKAANLPDPLATLAVSQGAILVLDDTLGPNLSQSVITFRKQVLDERPNTVRKLFQAYDRAVSDIQADSRRYVDLLVSKGSLPEPIKDVYQVTPFSKAQPPDPADFQRVIDWLVARGALGQMIDGRDVVRTGLTSGD